MRLKKLVISAMSAVLFSGVAMAQNGGLGPFNNSNYSAISAKAAQAQGDPVNVNVNLFLE